jgi:NAD(P)-dependent dehydrogenase (short-subunit alcohol dehydrogenase family)
MTTRASQYVSSLFELTGKTAVVIGGNGTLGGALCDALAGAGAHVIVVGRNAETCRAAASRIQQAGGSAEPFAADSTNRQSLQALVSDLQAHNRACDILINGAGTNSPTPFLEISDEEWHRIIDVNLRSILIACQVFGAYMIERQTAGSIINIASITASTPLSKVFTYSATKAAVLSLTQNLAREWGSKNIRVNALSPGFFPAEQNRKVLTPDRVANIMSHTPVGRFGEPKELAAAILLMASNAAGSFLTGANIIVDGGFTATKI